ncbi:MAG: DNA-processing protein DprA [Nitrospira sp.]|nr:DNA-processing protein DprA [Nitrospira sp.]MCP9442746.1 DNA-processing protein DprA [Nitrospira sp.]
MVAETNGGFSLVRTMDQSSLAAWLTLQAVDGVGDRTLIKLIQSFGSPNAVLTAGVERLVEAGFSAELAESVRRGPPFDVMREIDRRLTIIERLNVRVCTLFDPTYPVRLRAISDPPPLLYVSGTWPMSVDVAVAIVGGRRATPSGQVVTERIARELAERGITIVSGLARGIDAAAHRGALGGKGRTIAVLGCGVDRTYPSEHRTLRRSIEEAGGAVMSELPIGAAPLNHHFPRRNRIISGLSLGVLVSEAAKGSGSLITAKLALEQGRDVFAVPGPVTSESCRGSNGLIKEGAKLVEDAQDVLEEILPQLDACLRASLSRGDEPTVPRGPLGREDAAVYEALSSDAQSVDALIERTGLHAATVVASLLALELSGRVRQLPGQQYVKL